MRRAFITAIVTAGMVLGTAGVAAAVAPATTPLMLDPAAEQSVRNFLTQYGVDAATQERLFTDLQAGHLWDSASGKVAPTARSIVTTGNEMYVVATYPDGSISVTETPAPPAPIGGVTPMTFGECTVSSTTHYSTSYVNCKVSASNGLSWASFRADYTKAQGGSWISNVNQQDIFCSICSISDVNLHIVRAQSTNSLPAEASLDWVYAVAPYGAPSGTCYLRMNVTAGGVVSTPNNVALLGY